MAALALSDATWWWKKFVTRRGSASALTWDPAAPLIPPVICLGHPTFFLSVSVGDTYRVPGVV